MKISDALRPIYIGASVNRREDPDLLTGRARYIADVDLAGMVEMVVVRSPYAHARINAVDLSAARGAAGVHAAVAASDLTGISPFPDYVRIARAVSQFPLNHDRARFAGAPVAAVVADDRYLAEDAAELVDVDYDPLDVVVTMEDALAPDAPLLYDDWEDNRILDLVRHNEEIDEIFARSRVIKGSYTMHRHAAVPIETRGVVAEYSRGRLTLWASTQQPHIERSVLAHVLGIPESSIRVITPDVGGGFGAKLHVYPEDAVACWLAMEIGRPVRWIEDRKEHLTASSHSREQRHEMEAAVDDDGRITAIKCHIFRDLGSGEILPSGIGPALVSAGGICGTYTIPRAVVSITGVATNKTPSGAYRGYGMPEMVFALERFVEKIAIETGQDPIEFRRSMMIRPEDLPYTDPRGRHIDSGSHLEAFDRAVAWGRRARSNREARPGHRIGVGFAAYIEGVGPTYWGTSGRWSTGDACTITIDPDGKVVVAAAVSAMGQGVETMIATVAADTLGVPIDDVSVRLGDTDVSPYGLGSFGSRSTIVATGGVLLAGGQIRDKVLEIAAHKLEAAVDDLVIEQGSVHVRGSVEPKVTLAEIATAAYMRTFELPEGMEAGLAATATYQPPGVDHFPKPDGTLNACVSWSNSTHVALVDVELSTGEARVVGYHVVHDCGPLVNPEIVEGQIRGGVAQGIGGALYEHLVYSEDGQPLATSLMDYLLPTAVEIPAVSVEHLETPSPMTPLGLKGAGEAGVTGPMAAIANAVSDALVEFDVDLTAMPLAPADIRKMLRES